MRRTKKITPEGLKIKMLLVENNVTSKELAAKIGKSEATICDVLCGKNHSPETYQLIMDALS